MLPASLALRCESNHLILEVLPRKPETEGPERHRNEESLAGEAETTQGLLKRPVNIAVQPLHPHPHPTLLPSSYL